MCIRDRFTGRVLEGRRYSDGLHQAIEAKENVEIQTQENINESIDDRSDNPEYLDVKVLEDLPTFTGMDAKNYTLKSGDTESIPKYNARMLSDAGKVKLVTEVKV